MSKIGFGTGIGLVLAGIPMTQINQQLFGWPAFVIGVLLIAWNWYCLMKTVRLSISDKNVAIFALDGWERGLKIVLLISPFVIVGLVYYIAEGSNLSGLLKSGFRIKIACASGDVIRNKEVIVDGYFYKNCQFENVTFYYNGETSFQIHDSSVTGKIDIRTDNERLGNMLSFMRQFGVFNPQVPLNVRDKRGVEVYP